MSGERFRIKFSVFIIPRRGSQVLLALRKNTGYMDGMYGLVSGHVEAGESAEDAIIRETEEEAGVALRKDQLKYVFTMQRMKDDPMDDYIDIYFECTNWDGEFFNNEPEKCGGVEWFEISDLPNNTIPTIAEVLRTYPNSEKFMSKHEASV
jgi:8-oxo-dGTP diphosphatase